MAQTEHVQYMLDFMAGVLREIGPRESASPAEKRLAERVAAEWEGFGARILRQPFTCHPRAFLGGFPAAVAGYLLALPLYFWMPSLAFLAVGTATALLFLEVIRYERVTDRLFPSAEAENVVAVLTPRGPARRRLVVTAHLDSAYEVNLWYFFKGAAVWLQVVAALAFAGLTLLSLARTLAGLFGAADAATWTTLGWVAVALYPVVGLFLFFHTCVAVPGAMDDLAGVAVVGGLGRLLHGARQRGEFSPESTEVWLVAMGCEEAGLRGSMAFVRENRDALDAVPTYVLALDGIQDERSLTVVDREWFLGTRNDGTFVRLAMDVAAESGFPAHQRGLVMGGTDAAPFTRAGCSALTLVCQDVTRLIPEYHTRLDTLDRVRPQSLAVALKMTLEILRRLDRGDLTDPEPSQAIPAIGP